MKIEHNDAFSVVKAECGLGGDPFPCDGDVEPWRTIGNEKTTWLDMKCAKCGAVFCVLSEDNTEAVEGKAEAKR